MSSSAAWSHDLPGELGRFISEAILKQPARALAPDEPLISSGLIDSFSLVDLALHVDKAYGVVIEDTELNAETFDTLKALVALIESRRR